MSNQADNSSNPSYAKMLMLDDLESLLEEIEEHGLGTAQPSDLSADLREQMLELGVTSVPQLSERIAQLHAELDQED